MIQSRGVTFLKKDLHSYLSILNFKWLAITSITI